MIYPLTVSMTPAFMFPGDFLLKAQLSCLRAQINNEFDVLLVDPHYQKRKDYISDLASHYNLHLVHVPYRPNQAIAKRLDCAVFNAGYCYSESPRIVRLSCWRFIRPDFTEICQNSPTNMDFYSNNCKPSPEHTHPQTNHDTSIWTMNDDRVHWENVPHFAEVDRPPGLMPANCYGNYMIFREQWLSINGTDEVFTNTEHFEDINFCCRARSAGFQCARTANKLYRLHHWYGSFSGRANIAPDFEFKKPCERCDNANQVQTPNRYDLKGRLARGEIKLFDEERVWVCKTCSLSCSAWSKEVAEYTGYIASSRRTQATIIPEFKIGRNLRILTDDMQGKSLQEKVEIYNRSWYDARYYNPAKS